MLKALWREDPKSPPTARERNLIPDPWELESPAAETPRPETWQLPTEPHPLMSPAGNPAALQLAAHLAIPEEVLLQDWLKLKAEQGQELAAQVGKALGLLYWAETIGLPA